MPPKTRSMSQSTNNPSSSSNSQTIRNKKTTSNTVPKNFNKEQTQQALTNTMELDLSDTEQHNNSSFPTQQLDTPPFPRGFNTTDDTFYAWFDKPSETPKTLDKGKGKEQHPEIPKISPKPPVDWQVEYGRQC